MHIKRITRPRYAGIESELITVLLRVLVEQLQDVMSGLKNKAAEA